MKHLLIDFENIQPANLDHIEYDDQTNIWLFLGVNQQKMISLDLCISLCKFGKNVHFIKLNKSGKNALDFHLSFYMGKIIQQDPEAIICIMSRDGGYDVLIEHILQEKQCQLIGRVDDLADVTTEKISVNLDAESQSDVIQPPSLNHVAVFILKELCRKNAFRPRSYDNLVSNMCNILIQKEFSQYSKEWREKITIQIIDKLLEKKYISYDSDNLLIYHLEKEDWLQRAIDGVNHSKPKSITTLKNLISNTITCALDGLLDIDDVILYLKKHSILKQENQNIVYPPFTKQIEMQAEKHLLETHWSAITKITKANNKPKKKQSLVSALKSHFRTLADKDIENLVKHMINRKLLRIDDNDKVIYLK